MMPSMRTERGRFDAVFALGKLYAVAGSNGSHDLKSVECYDPQTEMWTSTAPLSFPRSHNGKVVVLMLNNLFVVYSLCFD
jgi:influenza virus NS1A-binding protein